MKIKNLLSICAILFVALIAISASCSSTNIKSKKGSQINNGSANSSTSENAVAPAKKTYPKNWPWKGVCMPSTHSDFHDVEYLHNIGVNFIRIQPKSPLRSKRENSNPKKAFYDELDWIDQVLDECKKYNMTSEIAFNYLVLDPNSGVDDKSAEFWSNSRYLDSAYNMVDIIAKRYKDRGDELSAYEVIGEPAITETGEKASTPNNLEEFFTKALARIRKYDQQRYFLVSPGPWGTPMNYKDFDGFNIKDDKLIYGAHMYLPNPYTSQGIHNKPKGINYPGIIKGKNWDKEVLKNSFRFLHEFENRTGSLIYIGEFQAVRWAPNGNQWVKDVADILNQTDWSWTYFAYNPDHEFWNPYYEVANPNDAPENWTLKNSGKEAVIWKYMVDTYFSKNKTK